MKITSPDARLAARDRRTALPHVRAQLDAYARAIEDPAFRQRVLSSYTGRYDVMDALWWNSKPLEPTPEGVPSPLMRLSDLRRRVFSQTGDSKGNANTTEELHALERELKLERHAIEAAIRGTSSVAIAARAGDQTQQPLDLNSDNWISQDREESTSTNLFEDQQAKRPRAHTLLIGVSIAGALLLGIPIGMQISSSTAAPAPLAEPSATPQPPAIVVFGRPQTPADIPSLSVPPTLEAESFRVLSAASPDPSAPGVYAARNTSNSVCLVIVHSESRYVSSCTVAAEFPALGIRLNWLDSVEYSGADGETFSSPVDWTAVWRPDGSFEMSGTGHETQN